MGGKFDGHARNCARSRAAETPALHAGPSGDVIGGYETALVWSRTIDFPAENNTSRVTFRGEVKSPMKLPGPMLLVMPVHAGDGGEIRPPLLVDQAAS